MTWTLPLRIHFREVQDSLANTNETSYDRVDIVCRVFNDKLEQLMDDLTKKHVLGRKILTDLSLVRKGFVTEVNIF